MEPRFSDALSEKIVIKAHELGFELVGIIPAGPSQTIDFYKQWLKNEYHGKMQYLQQHLDHKKDPGTLLAEVRSMVVLGMNYQTILLPDSLKQEPSQGRVSHYAWGEDYHEIIRSKLQALQNHIASQQSDTVQIRTYVDTGPLLEREYAQLAGLGWRGKNSNLIHGKKGSYFFLAEMLLSIPLKPVILSPSGSCGTCTRCIEACPTQAIVEAYTLDSRRCLSYLTIELKESIPLELRPLMGNHIFGCDRCQEVCPWNRVAEKSMEPGFQPRSGNVMPDLKALMFLTPEAFSQRFKGSPIKRAKRRGLLRNVAVALGNWGSLEALPALKHGLNDPENLIRTHSAWALGKTGSRQAQQLLLKRLEQEPNAEVQQEIIKALKELA
ncbi:tRNA epoxyqueuosine(34) reductase QueG [Deltaproteobacteria bacterium TL4]